MRAYDKKKSRYKIDSFLFLRLVVHSRVVLILAPAIMKVIDPRGFLMHMPCTSDGFLQNGMLKKARKLVLTFEKLVLTFEKLVLTFERRVSTFEMFTRTYVDYSINTKKRKSCF